MSADAVTVGQHTATPAAGSALTGTGTLIRFILRRDRIRLAAWVGAIGVSVVLFAASLPTYYTNAAARQARSELMGNPGLRAIAGPGFGLDDYTFGAMIAQEFLSWTAIFVALMSFLLVVRHTRVEEETGRAELVRSQVVGRHAHLVAPLVVVVGANLVLGALIAIGLASSGLESVTWEGSWLFGAAVASIGIVFAAAAAVTAQMSESGRTAAGMAGATFAAFYLVRAAGDMREIGGGALSWLSPIGWAQQTRAYVDDRWWPLLLPAALAGVLVLVALRMSTRRDFGAGLVQARPGPAVGSSLLSSPLGLAWRLHRASVMWWGAALFLFTLGYGALAGEVQRFVDDLSGAVRDWLEGIGGASIVDSWLAVVASLVGLTVAIFAVLVVLRPRSEESAGRAEPVLATAVSRVEWVGSHLAVALIGSAVLLLVAGLGLGISASSSLGDGSVLPRVIGATMAYAPAVWLTVGLAVALFGLAPRATLLVWILIAYAGLIGMFADLLGLPDWTVDLSPFGHVPLLPAVGMRWTPIVLLTAIAAALIAVGLVGFRRRDLASI
ncbi:MAG TPA: ABC transporter permease [Actinomycetota bacterium]|jgi:ABC-2 type transport system permease protein|nr:ABC transporter permease [Actinomycetota bacterium]